MTGRRSTRARSMSKDVLPEPITTEARNSIVCTPDASQDPAHLLTRPRGARSCRRCRGRPGTRSGERPVRERPARRPSPRRDPPARTACETHRVHEVVGGVDAGEDPAERRRLVQVGADDLRPGADAAGEHVGPAGQAAHRQLAFLQPRQQPAADVARRPRQQHRRLGHLRTLPLRQPSEAAMRDPSRSSIAAGGREPGEEALTVTIPYGWPVKPFDQQHPVRGYFNDPRVLDASHAFHFGVDVSAPDGTAVYAVAPGTVYIEDKGHAVAVLQSNGRSHQLLARHARRIASPVRRPASAARAHRGALGPRPLLRGLPPDVSTTRSGRVR